MAQSIYKFFMGRYSEAWYQLSEAEPEGFEAKLDEALEKVGAHIGNRTLEDRLLAELHVLGNHTAALQQLEYRDR